MSRIYPSRRPRPSATSLRTNGCLNEALVWLVLEVSEIYWGLSLRYMRPGMFCGLERSAPVSKDARMSLAMAGLMDGIKSQVGGKDVTAVLTEENDKLLTVYMRQVEQVNAFGDEYEKLSNEQLVGKTAAMRSATLVLT